MSAGDLTKEEALAKQSTYTDARLRRCLIEAAQEGGLDYPGNVIFEGVSVSNEIAYAAMRKFSKDAFDRGCAFAETNSTLEAESLTAEIARLEAELEEARAIGTDKADAWDRLADEARARKAAVRERDEARAAAGAMCEALEAALRKNPLIATFLDQGFWHAHHVDIVIRYNGEDRRYQADWIKDLWSIVNRQSAHPIGDVGGRPGEAENFLRSSSITALPQSPVGELVGELKCGTSILRVEHPHLDKLALAACLEKAATALLSLQAENERLKRAAESKAEGFVMVPVDIRALENVARAAKAYRDEESSDTPRMWRGKKLQDLANALDDALEILNDGQPSAASEPETAVSNADGGGCCEERG